MSGMLDVFSMLTFTLSCNSSEGIEFKRKLNVVNIEKEIVKNLNLSVKFTEMIQVIIPCL